MTRSMRAVPAVVLAAALVVGGAPSTAVAQERDLDVQLDDARSRAERLEAEIEELGRRASIVVEEYRQAQEHLSEVERETFAVRERVEGLRETHAEAERDASDNVVAIYQGRGTPDPMSYVDAADIQEFGVRHHYARAVAERDRAALDRLVHARTRLEEEEARLAERRRELAEETRALGAKRDEVEAAVAEREAALERARGDVAELVEEQRRRREEAEARRVREELARRRAEEERRRALATSTTTSAPTTTSTVAGDDAPAASTTTTEPPSPSPADLPPVHPRAGEAVEAALAELGTPYEWGGNGPDSYDCSGLTTHAWGTVGVTFPRSSSLQKQHLPPVPIEQLRPGDLVFFGDPVHHVGLYIGDGEMVNAPYTGTTVRIDSIYRSDINGAGRPG